MGKLDVRWREDGGYGGEIGEKRENGLLRTKNLSLGVHWSRLVEVWAENCASYGLRQSYVLSFVLKRY